MKNLSGRVILVVAIGLAVGGAIWLWQHGKPRTEALQAVSHLADNLAYHHGSELLNIVIVPAAFCSKTQAEQQEFIAKALADEISPEGVLALKNHAQFGAAKTVFPEEFSVWCQQARVDPDNCVAFKMERAGIRAEIVLAHEGQNYRVVRCKDVKQMAGENQI